LRAALRTHEPARKLDLMLSSALIEARSCERFSLLAPRLPPPLGQSMHDCKAPKHATLSCICISLGEKPTEKIGVLA
jgi:hypothetical protein